MAAICERFVELTLLQTDFSAVHELVIDVTAGASGHDYITMAADAVERQVLVVAELPRDQPACLSTHLKFNRAEIQQSPSYASTKGRCQGIRTGM